MTKCGLSKGYKQLLNFNYKIFHSLYFPLNLTVITAERFTYKNTLTSTIFLFLIHGNVFLSLFAYVFVSILCKISNDHLHHLLRHLPNFVCFSLLYFHGFFQTSPNGCRPTFFFYWFLDGVTFINELQKPSRTFWIYISIFTQPIWFILVFLFSILFQYI